MDINYTMIGAGNTGGSAVLYNIMNRLADRGHQVTVTLPRGEIDMISPNISQFVPNRLEALTLFCADATAYFFRKYLNKETYIDSNNVQSTLERYTPECDINVATHCLTANPVFQSGKGIPFYHMQSYEPAFFTDQHYRDIAKDSYSLPLSKIANSIWLRDKIKDNFGEEVPIINPGIDHNIFHPSNDETCNWGKKRVVSYGSNWKLKGFKDAIEAMKIIFKKCADVEWVVYGLHPMKYYSKDAPYKFIQGIFNEELAKLYSSSDVVFSSSQLESFPLPPIEAMACGTPVVTTRCGTEDYGVHEVNCLVVPPEKPELMAESILRILEDIDLADSLRENGLRTAKKFTWDNTVDKVEALFKEALK